LAPRTTVRLTPRYRASCSGSISAVLGSGSNWLFPTPDLPSSLIFLPGSPAHIQFSKISDLTLRHNPHRRMTPLSIEITNKEKGTKWHTKKEEKRRVNADSVGHLAPY